MNRLTSQLNTRPLNKLYLIGPMLLLVLTLVYRDALYAIFGESNYVAVHLIIEIFLIVVSFTIAVQAWLISPFILSNQRLYLGALFLAVGIIEIGHTMSYKGMPFFIVDSSSYSATWFYMAGRLLQAIGLFVVLSLKHKEITFYHRWYAYVIAVLAALLWVAIIYYPEQLLPPLVVEGTGLTFLKKFLQFTAMSFQLLLVIFLVKTYQFSKTRNSIVILASVYLILSDIMYVTYKDVYDIRNFLGHIFQLVGFYYLLRSLYYASVEKPFKDLIQAQNELKSSFESLEITKNKLEKSEEGLHYLAFHDELTELPNARSLTEELTNHIQKDNQHLTLFVVEIDRLHAFKESLGLSFSNLLIQKVAERLKQSLPSELFMSKLREGEFTIVSNLAENIKQIEEISLLIQDVTKTPFQIQHLAINLTLNVGITTYPAGGETVEELIKHAQVAMREAQKDSKRTVFYEPAMEKVLVERLILEQDLHYALARNEIYIEYQPKVDIVTGRIDSVEALIRWRHPEKGVISPILFVPIAEESGLIVPIGEWVLEQACNQAKYWHDAGYKDLGVAVNLSIRQFYQQDLVDKVGQVLQKTGLDPTHLELEITESMTMNTKHAITILKGLKSLGVKVAVDDFGTGYSSLAYLKDFPIDCLKIDRSFVRNIQLDEHGAVLVSVIISMAKHLKLKVVAEGVEDAEQLKYLSDLNCDSIQGYLFSKPVSADTLTNEFNDIQNKAYSIIGLPC